MDGAPLDDRSLLLGDGLFETILARRGQLVLLDAHLARMAAGCAVLGLPVPDRGHAQRLCEATIATSVLSDSRAAVRLTLTAGSGGRGLERASAVVPRLFAAAAPSPSPRTPAVLVTASVRRNDGSPAARLKSLSYLDNVLARREALAAGADEAVMLNTRGEVACAAAANLFWLSGDRLLTPALSCGVLDGVMRRQVIERARAAGMAIDEIEAGPEALAQAEAVFLTNSLIGARPVARLDGRTLAPNAMAERVADWLAKVA